MAIDLDRCIICGRGRRRRMKTEKASENEVYSLWKSECAETLCHTLFGSNSLLACFKTREFCNACQQLVRDVHFTHTQLKAFENTLKQLSDMLRKKIHINFCRIKEKSENEFLPENFDPNDYSNQQLTQIIHSVAWGFQPEEKSGPVKMEPMENGEDEEMEMDFWNSELETEEPPKIREKKRRRRKVKIEKDENLDGTTDVKCELGATNKRKRGRPKKEHKKEPIEKSKRTVSCIQQDCTFRFTTEDRMMAHLRGFHQGVEKPHYCPVCSKGFARRKMMMHHVRVVHKKRKSMYSHFCKFCSKGYVELGDLEGHYAEAHLDPNPFRCAFCPEVYSNSVDLRLHMKKMHPDPEDLLRPQCKICHKYFSNQNNLMVHSRLHGDPEQIPKCDMCNRIFASKGSLRKHTDRYHSEEVRYTCETCGKGFKYLPDLNDHSKKRHNEMLKKYACKICDKRFSTSSKCKLHEVTHTGIKEHVCDLCGKAFAFKGNLTVHQKLHLRQDDTPLRTRKKKDSVNSSPSAINNSFYENWTTDLRFNSIQ